MYAFAYLPIRLAVPLPWEIQLITNIQKYLSLEVPLTLLSLLALPMLLTFRGHRSFRPIFSTWKTVLHVLGGQDSDSLINSAKQGILILLVSGVTSLLIQYPVNLLRGEVVSAPFVERIRASNCRVESCHVTGDRANWYSGNSYENVIGRLDSRNYSLETFNEDSLKKTCYPFSESASGMLNWTMAAFLTQDLTVCDDPVLMKMQLAKWQQKLAFEVLPVSHASQSMCSSFESHGGQLEPRRHYQMTQRILAHDLLKFPHTMSSLSDESIFDEGFWAEVDANTGYPRSKKLKISIQAAVASLEAEYIKHRMLEHGSESSVITFQQTRGVFLFFFSAAIANLVCAILKHPACRRRCTASYHALSSVILALKNFLITMCTG